MNTLLNLMVEKPVTSLILIIFFIIVFYAILTR